MSNPDIPGAERLSVTQQRRDIGMRPSLDLLPSDVGKDMDSLMAPLSVVTVKGFTRSMAMYCCLRCGYENPEFLQEWWEKKASVAPKEFLGGTLIQPCRCGLQKSKST